MAGDERVRLCSECEHDVSAQVVCAQVFLNPLDGSHVSITCSMARAREWACGALGKGWEKRKDNHVDA